MKIPERITVRLVSADREDLSDVIVQMVVSTGQRNPRHIYFPKTDAAGQAMIERADFLGQFGDATESDLMGSWGDVNDVLATVEVSLYDPTPAILAGKSEWPLFKHEKTKWSSRATEYAYRTSCRNPYFTAKRVHVDLHQTSDFELAVHARGKTRANSA